jgi:hypothetical protein
LKLVEGAYAESEVVKRCKQGIKDVLSKLYFVEFFYLFCKPLSPILRYHFIQYLD